MQSDMEQSNTIDGAESIDWGDRVCDLPVAPAEGTWRDALVLNPHEGLPPPCGGRSRCSVMSGDCVYYHYGCDGVDDRGWGCGYRTLQSLSSWLCLNRPPEVEPRLPPSLSEIQETLVKVGDKPECFRGSREWIGTVEAGVVLQQLYGAPCRLVHVRRGAELREALELLHGHFRSHGSPLMMGGDRDASSRGVLGVCSGESGGFLLVMDPHYSGPAADKHWLQRRGWLSWKPLHSLDQSSFYNICLPLTHS